MSFLNQDPPKEGITQLTIAKSKHVQQGWAWCGRESGLPFGMFSDLFIHELLITNGQPPGTIKYERMSLEHPNLPAAPPGTFIIRSAGAEPLRPAFQGNEA